jgi:hypothetical protein
LYLNRVTTPYSPEVVNFLAFSTKDASPLADLNTARLLRKRVSLLRSKILPLGAEGDRPSPRVRKLTRILLGGDMSAFASSGRALLEARFAPRFFSSESILSCTAFAASFIAFARSACAFPWRFCCARVALP